MKNFFLLLLCISCLQLNVNALDKNTFPYIQPISVETVTLVTQTTIEDTDGDGIANAKDKCLNTSLNVNVDISGCKLLLDDDKDGVSNRNDKCPQTKPNTLVSTDGCQPDKDKDGIVDMNDECPNTSKDFIVDKVGCPQTTVLKIEFESAKYNILQKSLPQIEKFANFLQNNPDYQAIIYGYTDNKGDNSANQKLSKNRAKAIMNALINRGIKLTRLTAIGMGSKKPIADNTTPQGRAQNRRIEVDLLQ